MRKMTNQQSCCINDKAKEIYEYYAEKLAEGVYICDEVREQMITDTINFLSEITKK